MTIKIPFRGHTFDARTAVMLKWAEKRAGFTFKIAQGSYSTNVGVSAGTHDGGGAVDFGVVSGSGRIEPMLRALKDAGFAAWHRHAVKGVWPEHIHAIAIGCKDLAPLAAQQVRDYLQGRDGLADNAADPSYRPNPPVVFSLLSNRPIAKKK
jgi:hypothetical protein